MKMVKNASMGRQLQIQLLALMSFGTFGEGCTVAECIAVMVVGIIIAGWENEVGGG